MYEIGMQKCKKNKQVDVGYILLAEGLTYIIYQHYLILLGLCSVGRQAGVFVFHR